MENQDYNEVEIAAAKIREEHGEKIEKIARTLALVRGGHAQMIMAVSEHAPQLKARFIDIASDLDSFALAAMADLAKIEISKESAKLIFQCADQFDAAVAELVARKRAIAEAQAQAGNAAIH